MSSTPVTCGSPNEWSSCVSERSTIDAEEVVLSSGAAGAGTSGLWERSVGCSSSRAANSVGGAATDVSEEEDEARTEETGTAGAEDEGEMTNTPSSEGGAEGASSFCASMDPGTSNGADGAPSSCSG